MEKLYQERIALRPGGRVSGSIKFRNDADTTILGVVDNVLNSSLVIDGTRGPRRLS